MGIVFESKDDPDVKTGGFGIQSQQGNLGIVEYDATNWYQFLLDDIGGTPGIYTFARVSHDQGATWADADLANGPNDWCYSFCRDGNTVYAFQPDFASGVFIKPFNLATGSWGAYLNSGSAYTLTSLSGVGGFGPVFKAVCRGTNDIIFFYSGYSGVGFEWRVFWTTFDGTTLVDAANAAPGQTTGGNQASAYIIQAAEFHPVTQLIHAVMSSDRGHLATWTIDMSGAQGNRIDLINADFATGPSGDTWIQEDDGTGGRTVNSCSQVVSMGNRVALITRRTEHPANGYTIDNPTATPVVKAELRCFYADSGVNPTWSSSVVSTCGIMDGNNDSFGNGSGPRPCSLAYSDGKLTAAWVMSLNDLSGTGNVGISGCVFYSSTADPASWPKMQMAVECSPAHMLEQICLNALTTGSVGQLAAVLVGTNFDSNSNANGWDMLCEVGLFTPQTPTAINAGYPGTIDEDVLNKKGSYTGNPADSTGSQAEARCPQGYSGTLEYSGKRFQFLSSVSGHTGPGFDYSTSVPGFQLLARMSTDSGKTWSVVDAANGPLMSDFKGGFTVVQDGATVYLIGGTTGNPIKVQAFDLSNPTSGWGALTTYADFSDCLQYVASNATFKSGIHLCAVRRATGDMIVFYNGSSETISLVPYDRIYWRTFDGASFGTANLMGSQAGIAAWFYLAGAVLHPTTGLIHFLRQRSDFANAQLVIQHVSIDASNGFGTVQDIATDIALRSLGINYPYGQNISNYDFAWIARCSRPIVAGSKIALATVQKVADAPFDYKHQLIVLAADSAVNPSWVSGTVTDNGVSIGYGDHGSGLFPLQSEPHTCEVAYSAGTYRVAWLAQCSDVSDDGNNSGVVFTSTSTDLSNWSSRDVPFPTPSPYFPEQVFLDTMSNGKPGLIVVANNIDSLFLLDFSTSLVDFDISLRVLTQYYNFGPTAACRYRAIQ